MKKPCWLIFLCAFTTLLKAQNPVTGEIGDGIFRPNHYSIEIANTWSPAADIHNSFVGTPNLTLNPAPSGYASFSYSHFWRNGFGIKTGIRIGMMAVFTSQHLPAGAPNYLYGIPGLNMNYPFLYEQFPLCAAYRIHFKKNFNLEFSTGIMLELVPPSSASTGVEQTDANGNYYTAFEIDFNSKANSLYFDIPFEITASKVFKNKKELDFGLTYCMPFKTVGYGQYYFNMPGYNYNRGTFAVRNEYIGVKLGYTFLARKRFGKARFTDENGGFANLDKNGNRQGPHHAPVPWDTLFHPDHYSISMTPTWYFKQHTIVTSGTLPDLAQAAPSIQFGFSYEHLWPKGFGFRVGAAWGLTAFTLKEGHYSRTSDTLPSVILVSNYFNYFEFPICAVGRINLSKKYKLDFAAGILLDVTVASSWGGGGSGAGITGGPNYTLTPPDINMMFQTNRIPLVIGLPVEITCARVLRGKREIDFGFTGALALRSLAQAQYTAATTTAVGSGSVAIHNSYIGIKVAYTILGGAKKWSRKHG